MISLKNISASTKDLKSHTEFRAVNKLLFAGWSVIVPGQLIRLLETNGEFLAPQFVRHHLSNVADAWTAAAMCDYFQMLYSKAAGKEVKSKPITCAGIAFAACTAWEIYAGTSPNRKFDWVDQGLHTMSAAAYIGVRRRQTAKNQSVEPA